MAASRCSRTALFLLTSAFAVSYAEGRAHAEDAGPHVLSVAVLGIESDDAEDEAEALTTALRGKVQSSAGWSLADATQPLSMMTAALKCPQKPDPPCEGRIADQIKSDRFVWGSMKKGPNGKVTVELQLYDKGHPNVVVSSSYSDNLNDPNEDSLRREAQSLVTKLQASTVGSVTVHAGDAEGEVVVDGGRREPLKNGSAKIDLSRGSHQIEVNMTGLPSELRTIDVIGGRNIDLGAGPAAAPQDSGLGLSTRKIIGISAAAFGIGAGVTSIAFGSQYKSLSDKMGDELKNVPSGQDACAVTGAQNTQAVKDACNYQKSHNGDATAYSALAWTFGGLAVVGIGVGAYLFFTDSGSESKPDAAPSKSAFQDLHVLRIEPRVGREGGAMTVVGSF